MIVSKALPNAAAVPATKSTADVQTGSLTPAPSPAVSSAVTTSMMEGMKLLTSTSMPVAATPVEAPAPAPAPGPDEKQLRQQLYVERNLKWRTYLMGTANGDTVYTGPGGATITGSEIDRRLDNLKKYGMEDPSLLDKIIFSIFR